MNRSKYLGAAVALSALVCAGGVGCSSTDGAPSAAGIEANDPLGVPVDAVPTETRRVAELHLAGVRGSELAPAWSSRASLTASARPVLRPDVQGVAYYEFAVDEGGFILVSTGAHDHPIAHYRDGGERLTDELRNEALAAGKDAAHFYKLDALVYAAEDASEQLVAEIGARVLVAPMKAPARDKVDAKLAPASRAFGSFRDLKREYATAFAPALTALHTKAARAWATETRALEAARPGRAQLTPQSDDFKKGDPYKVMTQAWWIRRSDLLKDRIKYRQETVDGCLSGCGPVAWGQVTAYMDYLAETDLSTDPLRVYYRDKLRTRNLMSVASTTTFPFEEAKAMIWDLHDALNTRCLVGDAGATTPFGMNDYDDWANDDRGANIQLDADIAWGQEDNAEEWLKKGHPVVVGTGTYQHYAVALGYGEVRKSGDTDKFMYVNQGWGGSGNGWIPLSCFYSAAVEED